VVVDIDSTGDYKIGICCFSGNHTSLRRKSKDWFAWYQYNVSELGDMSIHICCFSVDDKDKDILPIILFCATHSDEFNQA
jgi:hypothetical protein